MKFPTAWMITAERVALGMKKKTLERALMARRTMMATIMPANGVRTPALELMAVPVKEAVTGYAPRKGPSMFAKPIATSSCEGLTV